MGLPDLNNAPAPEEAYARLDRAVEHLRTFDDECRAIFQDRDTYEFRGKPEHGGRNYVTQVRLREDVGTESWKRRLLRWGLLAGDGLHNLRSALDNLMYCAVAMGLDALPDPDTIVPQFPIARDVDEFASKCKKIEKDGFKLPDGVLGILDECQPYNRPQPLPGFEPLNVLHRLNNCDKHRALHLVFCEVHDVSVKVTGFRGVILTEKRLIPCRIDTDHFEDVYRVCFSEAQPTIDMKANLELLVGFEEGYAERSAAQILQLIHTETRWVAMRLGEHLRAAAIEAGQAGSL